MSSPPSCAARAAWYRKRARASASAVDAPCTYVRCAAAKSSATKCVRPIENVSSSRRAGSSACAGGEERHRPGEPAVHAGGLAHADAVVRRHQRERRRRVEREPHAVGRVVARVLAQHALADGHGPGDLAAVHEQAAEVRVEAPARHRVARGPSRSANDCSAAGVPCRDERGRVLGDRVRRRTVPPPSPKTSSSRRRAAWSWAPSPSAARAW